MKKTIKAWIYTSTALTTALYSKTFAAPPTFEQPSGEIRLNENSAEVAIQNYIWTAITFLYIAAVVYGLWGGFQILTAWSNDDKVWEGKKIIINSLIWIVVIFLAGAIVQWVMWIVMGGTA